MIWLALLLQTGAVSEQVETRVDGSQRWSIMSCPSRAKGGEIVVCGRKDADDAFEGPAAGRGANRDLSGAHALALQATPCRAKQGCNVIYGPSALSKVPGLLAQAVQAAGTRTPDKRGRVAIPLDEPTQAADRVAP